MASLNRVIILGNLGQDPELRYTQSQMPVATLNVATTDVRTGADGQKQELTEWHRIVVWGKQAENCSKYLSKGRAVLVEGRLQTRSWEDAQTGQKKYSTEIVAQTVKFVGGAPAGAAAGQRTAGRNQGQGEDNTGMRQAPESSGSGMDMHDSGPSLDDIPF